MNVVWFRNDLRLVDNPALHAACRDETKQVIGVYCYYPEQWDIHGVGSNQRALIIQQLKIFSQTLESKGIPLVVLNVGHFDNTTKVLGRFLLEIGCSDLFFNIQYPISERLRDKKLCESLSDSIKCHRSVGDSLVPLWDIVNQSGEGFKVYTPFSKAVKKYLVERPIYLYPEVDRRAAANTKYSMSSLAKVSSENIVSVQDFPVNKYSASALPKIDYPTVRKQLEEFCTESLENYAELRDIPSVEGTSRLSIALTVGTISASECYDCVSKRHGANAAKWLNELIWRDFYRAVMWHYPHVCKGQAFLPVDKNIEWNTDTSEIKQFFNAQTGVPIIDAAIKQLKETGWMHNRLRMVVASFLTKNLWADWRIGEAFFAEHLFDYDFASNNGGWQWCASVGTDAAPYFRVFNPQSQQAKFDPDALFVKSWLPELRKYSAKDIHQFEKNKFDDYPSCIVDLKASRKQSIERFKKAKESAALC